MKLEEQVTSLELAKKLKELGVTQGSFFYWSHRNHSSESPVDLTSIHTGTGYAEKWSAYTVAELGELLPDWSVGAKGGGSWEYDLVGGSPIGEVPIFKSNSEADARARMLAYLIENNLIHL